MKIAIIGGNGMLGYDLWALLVSLSHDVISYDLPTHDITKPGTLEFIVDSADIIVNCAAYTAVDKAESEQEKCYEINFRCVEKLVSLVAVKRNYLVHISTDFVFGNDTEVPLNEDSQVNPLGVYGKSKLEGELALQKTGASFSILRIQWTYGIHGDNFVSKIIKAAKTNDTLKIVSDQIGSPTPTTAVSKAIMALVKTKQEGLFHFASKEYTSRFEVTRFILNELGLSKKIVPCTSEEFITPAKRPKNSRFDCSKIDKILPFERLAWQTYLRKYLKITN
jgi:dTDP-4-dehydrorhamnose reductase